MIFVRKPVALALLAVASSVLSAHAQTSSLNPTVKVLARPQSPVPAECATDLSATAPAVESEPQPAPDQVMKSVPPSNDLRASMRRLQVTAEGDDYASFKTAFSDARRAAAAHPPGGERNTANDALQVFADIGRVWDYAMASPSGSFFDGTVQGGSLLGALKNYPDYGKTIAGDTLTVGDKTLYPTRETRRFLARESSRRLTRLGVSTPARVAQGTQPEAWPHRPSAAPPAPKTPVKSKSTPKTAQVSATPKPPQTKQKPAEKTARATTPKPKTPAVAATPVPKTKPAPPVTVAAATATLPLHPPVVTTTTAAPPPPVPTTTTAATTTTATTTSAAPATDTATSSATTSSATTSSTDTSAASTVSADSSATTTAPPAEKQNGNMNLLLAIVLILVGIGVLIVLFRASD